MDSYSLEAVLSLKDVGYVKKMVECIEKAEDLEKQSDETGASLAKSFTAGKVAADMLEKAFSSVMKSVGSAVDRLDALNNFPKVMDTLGYSSDLAKEKISYLADVTDALPTTLNEITQSTQTLTATLGDLEKGTDTAVALNDMFLAGGQGAEAAGRAMTQYNQILAKGKVDQQSWNTLVEVAPGQMNQLAQALLGASAGQRDLYAALQDGTVSVEQMNEAVIKLDKEGGESFSSFHDQALGATGGIGTAWVNLQNAIVKGTADIIDQMDQAAQAAGMPGLADSIDIVRGYMSNFFDMMAEGAGNLVTLVAPAADAVAKNFGLIAKVSGEVVAGVGAMKAIKKISTWLDSTKSAIQRSKSALDKYKKALDTFGSVVNATAAAESKRADATRKAELADKAVEKAMRSKANVQKAEAELQAITAKLSGENAKNAELLAEKEAKSAVVTEAKAKAERDVAAATEAKSVAAAASTAATEAETAAETLSNGQITLKTALLGVLSKEYTIAEAGQLAWNAAMNANPIGLLITGATALVTGLTLLSSVFGDVSDEEKEAADAEKEFHAACNDAVGSVQKTTEELERSATVTKEHSKKISDLTARYKKLTSQESLSASEKEELAGIVEELNANIEGLNLAYDKESGRLSKTTEEVEKKANAYSKMEEASQAQEALNQLIEEEAELTEQQLQAKEKLADAQAVLAEKQDEYNAALEAGNSNALYYLSAVEDAQETVNQYQQDLDNVTTALSDNSEAQKTYAQEVATAAQEASQAEQEATDATVEALANAILGKRQLLEEAIADHSVTLDQLSEKNQETVKTLQDTWQGYYESATNMFSTLSDEVTLSVDEMIANLQKNQEVISGWGDNMQNLRDRVDQMDVPAPVRDGLAEMLDYLQQAGPEQAGAVAAIAGATDEQLLALGDSWSNGATVAWDSMSAGMSDGAAATMEEVKGLVTDLGASVSETLEATDWAEIGNDCIKGLAEGFEADEAAIEAAKKSADDTIKQSKSTFQTHSPSKVYDEIGKNTNAGLAQGMKSSISQPVSAATNVALKVLTETKNRLQQMRNIGVQAVSMLANGIRAAQSTAYSAAYSVGAYTGQGFVNGINSQRGSVMAAAQSLASAASATISSALKIGSPSKVTRKQGYWTGYAFGLGIEDEIPFVEKMANKVASIAANIAVPDFSGVSSGSWNASLAIAGGNISYSMDGMRNEINELKKAIYAQPIQINTILDVDGREAGKALATYVKNENDYNTQVNNALMGVR